MRIITSGKNIKVTEGLKQATDRKLSKLEKYFGQDTEAQVTMRVEKERHIFEVAIPFSGTIIRAEEASGDMYASIDLAMDVLERQIRKHKTKLQKRKHDGHTIKFENIEPYTDDKDEPKIVKTKKFPIKPMNPEEAVLQMELLGHNFFVYRDGETDEVSVVYKRKDGNYGLIEAE